MLVKPRPGTKLTKVGPPANSPKLVKSSAVVQGLAGTSRTGGAFLHGGEDELITSF